MRVLVTGGAGFIGMHVVRTLAERGDHVTVLDVRPLRPVASWLLAPVRERLDFVTCGVDDFPNLAAAVKQAEPEAIVHIASVVDDMHHAPWLALRVNLAGTMNVLEAVRLFGVRRVINFSTVSVLTRREYEPIDDKHPVITATDGAGPGFYCASKLAAEAFCWGYQQSYGVDFITIRPSAIYGFGQATPNLIAPFVEAAVEGKGAHYATGADYPRDYTHAADVAQLTQRAIDIPRERVRDRIFWGGTGERPGTAADVVRIVKKLVPAADIGVGPGVSEEDLPHTRYRGTLNISNAREQLGYEPRYAKLEDGIAEFMRTHRAFVEQTQARTRSAG